jgi:hypothetical protein
VLKLNVSDWLMGDMGMFAHYPLLVNFRILRRWCIPKLELELLLNGRRKMVFSMLMNRLILKTWSTLAIK